MSNKLKQLSQKIQTQLAPYQQKWNALQARERTLLTTLAVLLLVCGFWLGIWQPIHNGIASAQQRLDNERTLATYVEQRVAQIVALRANSQNSGSTTVTDSALSGEINRIANELEMVITRIQTQERSRVLVVDEVPFETVLAYIERLSSAGVIIESVDVSSANEPGRVRVRKLQVRAAG
ncbi:MULTISPECIES: type II secretion system protein M [Gammaproteobacteria]|uniref:type II secretion system protein M n=1 Tax=Gammaproteobacteria TaxID=1236 RepID=UPI001401DA45|nr:MULTISPECIES: type II secretion system protein M [Gammaproteobacteria]